MARATPSPKIAPYPPSAAPSPSYEGWCWLTLLMLFSLFLRVWQIGDVPPGLHFDEAAHGLTASSILNGNLGIFYSDFTGHEPLYMYIVAVFQIFMGRSPATVRLPSAIIGTATIAACFWLGCELLAYGAGQTKQAAYKLGWLAALACAFCYWELHLSREGYRVNLLPLFGALAVAALWRTLRLRQTRWAVIAGVLTGLNLYTYLAARFLPFVFVGFVLYLLIIWGLFWRNKANRSQFDRALIKPVIIWAGVAVLTVLPLAIYFAFHRSDFFQRTSQVSVLGNSSLSLWKNILAAVGMFGFEGSGDMKYNLSGRPVFDTFTSLFFYGGVVIALVRMWLRPVYGFLLIWLVVMLMPAVLSVEGNNPLRAYGALPPAIILWSLGALCLWQLVDRFFQRKRKDARTQGREKVDNVSNQTGGQNNRSNQTSILKPFAPLRLRVFALKSFSPGLLLVRVALILMLGLTYNDYFNRWAKSPELYSAFDTDYADLAQWLLAHPSHDRRQILASEYLNYPTIAYLAPGSTNYNWVNISQAVVVPQGATKFDYIVPDRMFASQNVPPAWYKSLGVEPSTSEAVVSSTGRKLGNRLSFNLPQPLSADNLPLTAPTCGSSGVNFNDDVVLLGHRLNSPAQSGQPLSLTLYWQAKRASGYNYQIFVHVVNAPDSDRKWGQQDANGSNSRGWQPGDIIVGQYNFTLDPNTPPGSYLIEIGLYDVDKPSYPRAPILTSNCADLNPARTTYLIRNVSVK